MDSLGLIYIRKVFSLFIYLTLERRYCNVKSESEIFDLRNVVIVIVVTWPVVGKCTVCVFDVRWHIDRHILETLWVLTTNNRITDRTRRSSFGHGSIGHQP